MIIPDRKKPICLQPTRRELIEYGIGAAAFSKMARAQALFRSQNKTPVATGPVLIRRGSGFGANTFTVTLDTSNANFVCCSISRFVGASVALTENKGNGSPTQLTEYFAAGGFLGDSLYYWENPTCGSGHVFTVTGSGIFAALTVHAFSGMATSSLFQSGTDQGGHTNGGTTVVPSAPAAASGSTVWLFSTAFDSSATFTVDTGFQFSPNTTGQDYEDFNGLSNEGIASAYLIEASGSTITPQWTSSGSNDLACAIAAFKGA